MADAESTDPAESPRLPHGSTEVVPAEPEPFRGLFGDMEDEGGESAPGKKGKKGKKNPRGEMGFLDHLEEFRMMILKSLTAGVVGMAIVGTLFVYLLEIMRYPLVLAVGEPEASHVLISPLEPMGGPVMVINVSIFGGVIIALPLIAYFIINFVAPGLTIRERGMLRPALWSALLLFLVGALGCFFIMLPAALRFSYHLDQMLHFDTKWSARYYYSFVSWAVFGTGLAFQFPLILVILQVLGIVETATLRRLRRHAILVILVVGGVIAPSPDPLSMLLTAAPMMALYEASLAVGSWLRKRRLAAEAREAATGDG